MKKLISVLALLASLTASSALAAGTVITATVKGMACESCARMIKKRLAAEPSVAQVDVNVKKEIVKVDLREGQELSDESLKKALVDLGYRVEKVARK